MSEIWDATYQAIRSKVSGGDIGQAAENVFRESGLSHAIDMIKARCDEVIYEYARPSFMLRVKVTIDGNMYCASYGDMPEGIHGFGESIALAFEDFDRKFYARDLGNNSFKEIK